jgi:hypothetical protein
MRRMTLTQACYQGGVKSELTRLYDLLDTNDLEDIDTYMDSTLMSLDES